MTQITNTNTHNSTSTPQTGTARTGPHKRVVVMPIPEPAAPPFPRAQTSSHAVGTTWTRYEGHGSTAKIVEVNEDEDEDDNEEESSPILSSPDYHSLNPPSHPQGAPQIIREGADFTTSQSSITSGGHSFPSSNLFQGASNVRIKNSTFTDIKDGVKHCFIVESGNGHANSNSWDRNEVYFGGNETSFKTNRPFGTHSIGCHATSSTDEAYHLSTEWLTEGEDTSDVSSTLSGEDTPDTSSTLSGEDMSDTSSMLYTSSTRWEMDTEGEDTFDSVYHSPNPPTYSQAGPRNTNTQTCNTRGGINITTTHSNTSGVRHFPPGFFKGARNVTISGNPSFNHIRGDAHFVNESATTVGNENWHVNSQASSRVPFNGNGTSFKTNWRFGPNNHRFARGSQPSKPAVNNTSSDNQFGPYGGDECGNNASNFQVGGSFTAANGVTECQSGDVRPLKKANGKRRQKSNK